MPLPPHHHHQSQPYYGAAGTFPGAARQQPAAGPPIGSHNQFIPLQVDSWDWYLLKHFLWWYWTATVMVTHLVVWQVTKKRASANKKNQETREFYNASHTVARSQTQRAQNQLSGQSQAQSGKVDQPHQHTTNSNPSPSSPSLADAVSVSTAAPHTPPRQNRPATGHTPGSASKRKHRKLAVNFEAAKVSEWWVWVCMCMCVCVCVRRERCVWCFYAAQHLWLRPRQCEHLFSLNIWA